MNSNEYRKYLIENADEIILDNQQKAVKVNEYKFTSTKTENNFSDLKQEYLFNFKIQSNQVTPVIYEKYLIHK
tara:strand:- start:10431 stop:10649 length:219 start_codon:yes stop_codon:yes gene_type:complete